MTPIPINDGTAEPLTAAGACAPSTGLDISGLSGPYELQIQITDLHCASGVPKARIVIEDTVDAFTTRTPVCMWNVQGPINSASPINFSKLQDEAPSLRIGVASAKLRLYVVYLDGTTPSITLNAALWN